MEPLDGQIAIVTGGARGIGAGIVRVLASEGAQVVIGDLDRAAADGMAADIDGACAITVDVTRRESTDELARIVVERYGRIDIVAANAGIYPLAQLDELDDSAWDRVMALNVKGALHTVQACLSAMRTRHYGRIVLTSSITGPITGHPGCTHYGASKAAMVGMMRSAAIELAPDGITINAVLPGNVRDTGFEGHGDTHVNQMLAAIPMGALQEPQDIGWAVRFLASSEARYITGQTLVVDGGQVLPETHSALTGPMHESRTLRPVE